MIQFKPNMIMKTPANWQEADPIYKTPQPRSLHFKKGGRTCNLIHLEVTEGFWGLRIAN